MHILCKKKRDTEKDRMRLLFLNAIWLFCMPLCSRMHSFVSLLAMFCQYCFLIRHWCAYCFFPKFSQMYSGSRVCIPTNPFYNTAFAAISLDCLLAPSSSASSGTNFTFLSVYQTLKFMPVKLAYFCFGQNYSQPSLQKLASYLLATALLASSGATSHCTPFRHCTIGIEPRNCRRSAFTCFA